MKTVTQNVTQTVKKLFNNLRKSCVIDLKKKHPSHVVDDWIGHTSGVSEEFYCHTLESHYEAIQDEALGFRRQKKTALKMAHRSLRLIMWRWTMDDFLDEFILCDIVLSGGDSYCPYCSIGLLQILTETQVICDIYDRVRNTNSTEYF